MRKKLLIILISASILANLFVPAALAAEEDEFAMLKLIGTTLDLSNPEKTITRAELAKYAVELSKIPVKASAEPMFSDVPKKHWAYGIISTAVENGLMSGANGERFAPDSAATVMDGGRALLYLLGYSFGIEAGWTNYDYINCVRETGLTSGIKDGELTYRAFAKMIVRMLELPIVRVGSISGKGVFYDTDKEMTYLRHNYKMIIKKGRVESVGDTSLIGFDAVSDNRIKIDGIIYIVNGIKCAQYLGDTVKFAMRDTNDDPAEILCIWSLNKSDDVIIDAEDIVSYKNRIMEYCDGESGRKKIIEAGLNCQVILNGHRVKEYNENDFKPLAGHVRFSDCDGDGEYDIVFITSILYYWVNSFSEDRAISDKLTGERILLDNAQLTCSRENKPASPSEIKSGSILAVLPDTLIYSNGFILPGDVRYVEAEILKDIRAEGKITSIDSDGCEIGGTYYEYSAYFKKLMENKYISAPGVNFAGTFYLNEKKEIIAASSSSYAGFGSERAINYGYLLGISRDKGLSDVPIFKLIDEKAQAVVYKGADKFYLNEVKSEYSDLIRDARIFSGGEAVKQLITYKLNSEGNIKQMYTARDYTSARIKNADGTETDNPYYNLRGYYGYDEENFSLNFKSAAARYRASLNHQYTPDENTLVFIVPSDPNRTEKYKVGGREVFVSDNVYPISVYDASSSFTIGVAVIDSGLSAGGLTKDLIINAWSGLTSFMIDEIGKTMVEGEQTTVLKGVSYECKNGFSTAMRRYSLTAAEKELTDTDTKYTSNYHGMKWEELEPGDVIHYQLDDSGAVERFRVVFRYRDLYSPDGKLNRRELNSPEPTVTLYMVCASIEKVLSDGSFVFNVSATGGASGIRVGRAGPTLAYGNSTDPALKGFRVFIFDKKREKVIIGSAKDIEEGDDAYIRCESGEVVEVFIYR